MDINVSPYRLNRLFLNWTNTDLPILHSRHSVSTRKGSCDCVLFRPNLEINLIIMLHIYLFLLLKHSLTKYFRDLQNIQHWPLLLSLLVSELKMNIISLDLFFIFNRKSLIFFIYIFGLGILYRLPVSKNVTNIKINIVDGTA